MGWTACSVPGLQQSRRGNTLSLRWAAKRVTVSSLPDVTRTKAANVCERTPLSLGPPPKLTLKRSSQVPPHCFAQAIVSLIPPLPFAVVPTLPLPSSINIVFSHSWKVDVGRPIRAKLASLSAPCASHVTACARLPDFMLKKTQEVFRSATGGSIAFGITIDVPLFSNPSVPSGLAPANGFHPRLSSKSFSSKLPNVATAKNQPWPGSQPPRGYVRENRNDDRLVSWAGSHLTNHVLGHPS